MKNYFVHYGFNESYGIAKDLANVDANERPDATRHLASLVFIAFTYESAINHLGELTFPTWREHFERLSPEAKLALLADKSSIKTDFSCRPFQSFSTVFKVRNALAHPKVSELEVRAEHLNTPSEWPQPKWKAQASNLKMCDALSDLDGIILLLENALQVHLPPRFLLAEHVVK